MHAPKVGYAAIIAALFLVGCAGPAGDVNVLQSDRIAVTPGATVAWAPLTQNAVQNNDPRIDNDIIRQRIRTAIESNFAAKGYRLTQDPNAAQYLVSYYVGLQDRTDVRVDSPVTCGWRGCISGYGWGMYGAPADVRTIRYAEGTLIVDVIDRTTNQLAWRATSQRRVDEGDGSQERISATVADMLQSLPGVASTP